MNSDISISLKDIFNIKGTRIFNPDTFPNITTFSIDSRNIKKGDLFIAIKGQRFDGHNFVNDAINAGAEVIAIEKKYLKYFNSLDIPFIMVDDTTKFLGQIASIWRSKLKTKVVGIGGSNGKTTTKEILAQILSNKYSINKTIANNNNHIGVPLTILSTTNENKYLIVEFGSNHPGEIKYLASIANPDYALVTNIGDSHLEFFNDRKGVLKEETYLYKQTLKNNGLIFVNYDDKLLRSHFSKQTRKISYSFNNISDFKAEIKNVDEEGYYTFQINQKKNLTFTSPIIGEIGAVNYFASIVVAKYLGMTYGEIKQSEKNIEPFDKRLEIKKYNSIIIINDCYNANPSSMLESLLLLSKIKPDYYKIAILGDMFELGHHSISKHREIGISINNLNINEILTIGEDSSEIFNSISDKSKIKKHFNNKSSLISFLERKIRLEKTVVLIKGSRRMHLEEINNYLEGKYI